LQEEYIDGGMGCNNPVKILIKEALLEFEPEARISCVLSIGTGVPKVSSVDAPSRSQRIFPSELIDVLKEFTKSSESVAKDVDSKYKKFPGLVHRLDVDKGLEKVSLDEWDRMGEVKSHTGKYLERDDVDHRIETIVAALMGTPEQTYRLNQLGI
jgi:predicted RNA-binding protein